MIPFPDKKYDIIYADPPWFYRSRPMSSGSAVTNHYPDMTLSEMQSLPVKDIADNDCLLFLWSISPQLEGAMQIGQVWGFKYATVGFIWDKHLPITGNYTMSQCEMCLIFKKGKIPQPRGKRNIRQFLSSKRGSHSDKPDEVRHRITEMFPTQSKIELFARVSDRLFPPMEGWDYWGNEA